MSASDSQTNLSGWGRYPTVRAVEVQGSDLANATEQVVLTRGLGRSYGDASLPALSGQRVANSCRANKILLLDEAEQRLRVQAGVALSNLSLFLNRRGLALPVLPGTANVTVGGMAAADIHGKNHHVAGTFGEHVRALRIKTAEGRVLEVSAEQEPELFAATLGGMGLTGHILEVEVALEKIPSPWIFAERSRSSDFLGLISALRDASARWPMTVAWCDLAERAQSFGRGELIAGRWAQPAEAASEPPHKRGALTVPDLIPNFALNRWSIHAVNTLRFATIPHTPQAGCEHPDQFFHPLDSLQHWNRLYGRRGLLQYQCVLPHDISGRSYERLARIVQRSRSTLCLCVIKDCGTEGRGMLSFPKRGISFAMDFPISDKSQQLVDDLNEHVCAEGGRIYLAKDVMTRPAHFQQMEGDRLERFLEVRQQWDPKRRLGSLQSKRLFGY